MLGQGWQQRKQRVVHHNDPEIMVALIRDLVVRSEKGLDSRYFWREGPQDLLKD